MVSVSMVVVVVVVVVALIRLSLPSAPSVNHRLAIVLSGRPVVIGRVEAGVVEIVVEFAVVVDRCVVIALAPTPLVWRQLAPGAVSTPRTEYGSEVLTCHQSLLSHPL
jgi:hypothetical protein